MAKFRGNARERAFAVRSRTIAPQKELFPVGFGLGNFFRFQKKGSMAMPLDKMKTLGISSVEMSLYPKVGSRRLTQKQKEIIRLMDYVSVHAPPSFAARFTRSRDSAIRAALLLNKRCLKMGAKYIVIHPTEMPRPEVIPILKKGGLKILTENPERVAGQRRNNFEGVLAKHPDFGLCLDVSHAFMWSPNETKRIVEAWGDRIVEVHFSNFEAGKTHQSFVKGNKQFVDSVQPLKPLLRKGVQIIIEESLNTTDTRQLWEEIRRIRRMLS